MKSLIKNHPIAAILIADEICCAIRYIAHEIRLSKADKDDTLRPYGAYRYVTSIDENRSVLHRGAGSVFRIIEAFVTTALRRGDTR